MSETTRRAMLAGAAGVGAAAALAACGTGNTDSGGTTGDGGGGQNNAGGGNANTLGKKSDIPVGGGKIFDGQKVVVTQPSAGQFKAFSAICTHQGCTVSSVKNGTINCPCHSSMFSITDGSVKGGPAPKPLASRTVTVNGDDLVLS